MDPGPPNERGCRRLRHQGGHQEELEEELEEEVERRVRGDHSSNQTQVRMHG